MEEGSSIQIASDAIGSSGADLNLVGDDACISRTPGSPTAHLIGLFAGCGQLAQDLEPAACNNT